MDTPCSLLAAAVTELEKESLDMFSHTFTLKARFQKAWNSTINVALQVVLIQITWSPSRIKKICAVALEQAASIIGKHRVNGAICLTKTTLSFIGILLGALVDDAKNATMSDNGKNEDTRKESTRRTALMDMNIPKTILAIRAGADIARNATEITPLSSDSYVEIVNNGGRLALC
jgi:hypothetical protein